MSNGALCVSNDKHRTLVQNVPRAYVTKMRTLTIDLMMVGCDPQIGFLARIVLLQHATTTRMPLMMEVLCVALECWNVESWCLGC